MRRRRFLSLAAGFACAPRFAKAAEWRGIALGAECRVTLTGPRSETAPALEALPGWLAEIEGLFSLYDPASALCRLNATGQLSAPDPRLAALLATVEQAHALTGGLFDPTVQPLWQAFARGEDPAPARALIGWDRVRHGAGHIALAPGQALTLNGIAQGAASDLVRDRLAARGFTSALIDLGEIAALGGPFRLTLSDPAFGELGQRSLSGGAIATSSPGALTLGARSHILAPDDRPPLWSTVSIEARSATLADALSTAAVFLTTPELGELKRSAGLRRITLVDPRGDLRSL